MKRTGFVTLSLVSIGLMLAAAPDPATAQDKRLSTSIVFPSNSPERGFYPFFVARELKYFDEEKLDVKFVNAGGSGAAIQQVIAGQVDFGIPHSGAVLSASSRGNPIRYLYTYTTAGNFGMFVKEGSPIKSVRDLKGKTVGISEQGGGEVAVLNAALRAVGIDPIKDVKYLVIGEGGPVTFQAIDSNQVDAHAGSYNDIIALTDTAAGRLKLREITPAEFKVFPSHGIAALQKVLDSPEKREAAIRLARAVAKATLFCQSSRDACMAVMKKAAPVMFQREQLGMAFVGRALMTSRIPAGTPLGSHRPDAWEKFIEFTKQTDPKFKAPDLKLLLVQDYIGPVNQFDKARVASVAKKYKMQ